MVVSQLLKLKLKKLKQYDTLYELWYNQTYINKLAAFTSLICLFKDFTLICMIYMSMHFDVEKTDIELYFKNLSSLIKIGNSRMWL